MTNDELSETQRLAAVLVALLGHNPPPFSRDADLLANAGAARATYELAHELLTGDVPPPDDQILAGAERIVRLAHDLSVTGTGTFHGALAALRSLLVGGSPHRSMHDALRQFGLAGAGAAEETTDDDA